MHEDLYESNRNYGELCTKTCMKAIEAMANYARNLCNRSYDELRTKTYMEAIETMVNYARKPI